PSTSGSSTSVGVTSGSATRTPSATTMPYQNGTTPSYSSWPPAVQTPSAPAYQSAQPTYQTNSALGQTNATTSTGTQTSNPACNPGSPITPAPAGATTTGTNGCP